MKRSLFLEGRNSALPVNRWQLALLERAEWYSRQWRRLVNHKTTLHRLYVCSSSTQAQKWHLHDHTIILEWSVFWILFHMCCAGPACVWKWMCRLWSKWEAFRCQHSDSVQDGPSSNSFCWVNPSPSCCLQFPEVALVSQLGLVFLTGSYCYSVPPATY